MHFATFEYATLLSLVFVLYWALGHHRLARLLVLLAASYVFYAWWSIYYLPLIIASSAIDFVVGARLHRATSTSARKGWLLASLAGNLGMLALFKYFNFFMSSMHGVLTLAGVEVHPPTLSLALPVGISFYTFQSMSYTIDIYRGDLEPTRNPLAFAVFVAFFPQLVAGPIVRAREFLPQLQLAPALDPKTGSRGLFLIATGLAKKALIADLLAVNLVDRVFETPALYTSAEILMGVYGYAIQIYCDFSAYSDIAIGSALLLGLKLPDNFRSPYRASNLGEFWRRWHISLSTWLRDYLYIPLGGSRHGALATYRNLLLTMVLGGLWHGASWTFVLWGALHGIVNALNRAWQRTTAHHRRVQSGWQRALGILVTFHVVCLGWILFRSPTFGDAWAMLDGLAQLTSGTANVTPLLWGLLAAGFATHAMPTAAVSRIQTATERLPSMLQAALLVGVVLAIRQAATTQVVPFIYFQF